MVVGGSGVLRGGEEAVHLHEQIYFFSILPTALPGGIRSARTQQASRPRRWLRSLSTPAAGLLPTPRCLPAHLAPRRAELKARGYPSDQAGLPEPACGALTELVKSS